MSVSEVHVAVGVILNANGAILLSKRHADAHQGGLWEFPGGKVEHGESLADAMYRELEEELGILIDRERLEPLVEVRHDYGDKQVFLDTWLVWSFAGEPHGREGQPLAWVEPDDLADLQFPAANDPIVDAVQARLS